MYEKIKVRHIVSFAILIAVVMLVSFFFPQLGPVYVVPLVLVWLFFTSGNKKKKPPSVEIPTKKEMWDRHY